MKESKAKEPDDLRQSIELVAGERRRLMGNPSKICRVATKLRSSTVECGDASHRIANAVNECINELRMETLELRGEALAKYEALSSVAEEAKSNLYHTQRALSTYEEHDLGTPAGTRIRVLLEFIECNAKSANVETVIFLLYTMMGWYE